MVMHKTRFDLQSRLHDRDAMTKLRGASFLSHRRGAIVQTLGENGMLNFFRNKW
jgi:hypothetical protein